MFDPRVTSVGVPYAIRCARTKEIAIRLAIGATRWQIIRQLLIESLSLSFLGGIAGLAFAFWADKALMGVYLPSDSGGSASLEDFRGKTLVLYFFPKADTPG